MLLTCRISFFGRGREGVVSTIKTTSNLLAAVLILTAIPPEAGLSQPALEHACFLISQKLLEEKDVCRLLSFTSYMFLFCYV